MGRGIGGQGTGGGARPGSEIPRGASEGHVGRMGRRAGLFANSPYELSVSRVGGMGPRIREDNGRGVRVGGWG